MLPMLPIDARREKYRLVRVFNVSMIFSEYRLNSATLPDTLWKYEVVHNSEDWRKPTSVRELVVVNFFGTLLSKQPLEMNGRMWKEKDILSNDDWVYEGSDEITLDEYMKGDY